MAHLFDTHFNTPHTIRAIEGHPILVERLYEMGFLPGETIQLTGRLLFGDPYIVEVRGIQMALRREELACLQI